eukprot:GHVR01124174.1.p1 GENE.GHVR01124174.1~~GHVR01124174.1.p1  ORF type:complete len:102 (+),score=56.02 GHVR01124174.1:63-368(+)
MKKRMMTQTQTQTHTHTHTQQCERAERLVELHPHSTVPLSVDGAHINNQLNPSVSIPTLHNGTQTSTLWRRGLKYFPHTHTHTHERQTLTHTESHETKKNK